MIFINELKRQRDIMLFSTDWTQGVDSPLTEEAKVGWAVYRQELRDMFQGHAEDDSEYYTTDNGFWPLAPSRFKCIDGSMNQSLYTEDV
jgi:hypothetical protein